MSTDVPTPDFGGFGLPRPVVAALKDRGITAPFPIQAETLPDSLAGRDVLGRGRTGSGKTVAFALPLITRIERPRGRRTPGRPRGLVLVPTRELAVQVADTVDHLAQAAGLKVMTVVGGVRYTGQLKRLAFGVDIVIATPGRLEDLIDQGACDLSDVQVTVLDEADLMADMGFLPAVTRILDATPPDGQRMLFSATLDNEVARLVKDYLHDPREHAVDPDQATPDTVHHLFLVDQSSKAAVVRELVGGGGRTLAFTRTKSYAQRLAEELNERGIPARDLHGNLSQAARQRNLAAFAEGRVSVLVATDIAARGIHVDDVGLVVHIDPPADPKAFLHRSGRTARAGAEGIVVTLAARHQNKAVRTLMGLARIKPVQTVVKPGDEIISQVRAPRLEPGRPTRASIFEPDPEDEPEERPERSSRRDDRGYRPRAASVGDRRGERSRGERSRGERTEWTPREGRPQKGDGRPRREGGSGGRPAPQFGAWGRQSGSGQRRPIDRWADEPKRGSSKATTPRHKRRKR